MHAIMVVTQSSQSTMTTISLFIDFPLLPCKLGSVQKELGGFTGTESVAAGIWALDHQSNATRVTVRSGLTTSARLRVEGLWSNPAREGGVRLPSKKDDSVREKQEGGRGWSGNRPLSTEISMKGGRGEST